MIPDYGCNAVYFSEWLKKDYSDIYKGLVRILNKHNVAYDIIPNTKDVWCRDYMPLQLDKERYLCYEYKPDYLMNSARNRKYITDSLNVCRDMQLNIKETPLIMDGGNVVKVGNKAIMTEKVFVENPSMDEDSLKKQLEKQMECEVVFIPWDRNEKYGHSDGIIKPISDNTILMTNYHDFDREYTNEVVKRLSCKFEIETLSYKVRKIALESWAYINFLTVGKLIVLPALGKEEDEQALSQIKRYYPECWVEQLKTETVRRVDFPVPVKIRNWYGGEIKGIDLIDEEKPEKDTDFTDLICAGSSRLFYLVLDAVAGGWGGLYFD